jgi:hypothetical protein
MKDKLNVWLKELLTSSTKVSSKRIVAIFVTINLIVLSYVAFVLLRCLTHSHCSQVVCLVEQ